MDGREMTNRMMLIDYQVMNLLMERLELGVRLKKLRADASVAAGEEELLADLADCSRGIMRQTFTGSLFRNIIDETRFMEEQNLRLIGFQGEHGAFSEEASRAYDPSLVPIPYREFSQIFRDVSSGVIDFAIVPVENSLGGAVTPVMDLLVESETVIVGEVVIPIHHCLLVLPDMDYRDLKVVYSHSRALAQCRNFISRHKIEPRPYYDTAGSAKMLSENRPDSAGAIGSRLCAEIYHLDVLNENIEDYHSNSTRFNIVSRTAIAENGDKCSIAFVVGDSKGSLLEALRIFSDAGINVARIDSRPLKDAPGRYIFSLDFEGSDKDETVLAALKRLKENSIMLKFLGCYRKAR